MVRKGIDTYRELKINDMSQRELIVFLYETAINLTEEAKDTIESRDLEGTHERLGRVRNIFLHLLSTLNLEAGGDLARRLSALYSYFIEKVTVANTTKSVQELDDIIPIVREIKEAWEETEFDDDGQVQDERNNKSGVQFISVEA